MIRLHLASALPASFSMSLAVVSCTTSTEEAQSQTATGDDNYCPAQPVTREENAAFLVRAFKL